MKRRRLNHFIPFGMKRRSWSERYFNGHSMNLNTIWQVLAGMGLGAGLMYVLDPDQGRKRRDKVASTVNRTGQVIGSKSRDLKDRAREIIAEKGSNFRSSDGEKDSQLRQ